MKDLYLSFVLFFLFFATYKDVVEFLKQHNYNFFFHLFWDFNAGNAIYSYLNCCLL